MRSTDSLPDTLFPSPSRRFRHDQSRCRHADAHAQRFCARRCVVVRCHRQLRQLRLRQQGRLDAVRQLRRFDLAILPDGGRRIGSWSGVGLPTRIGRQHSQTETASRDRRSTATSSCTPAHYVGCLAHYEGQRLYAGMSYKLVRNDMSLAYNCVMPGMASTRIGAHARQYTDPCQV